MTTFLAFWGKAGDPRRGQSLWHPVAYHGLDVAAVADRLLRQNERKLARIAGLLGLSPDGARRLLVALIAMHDVGKFAEAFQAKVPTLWPAGALGPFAVRSGPRHDQTSWELRAKLDLPSLVGIEKVTRQIDRAFETIWFSIAAHHGRPVDAGGNTTIIQGMTNESIAHSIAFARGVTTALGPFETFVAPPQHKLAAASWAIAGLTNVADWIGSDRSAFKFERPTHSLTEYWPMALARAESAIDKAGISPSAPAATSSFQQLFPQIEHASPLQRLAAEMQLPSGPMLAIVEDVTGSGKTEAALMFASRLMQNGRADGLFFALPTMATANAMFDRLGENFRRLFESGATPSLVLAHGRRLLNTGFTSSILDHAIATSNEQEAEKLGDLSGAVCAAWIADDRRKAFLAQVGVGTIDQALLGVLPSKHQALRLWGLSDRVLIVDEAHAYDAYMGRELERLLQFHAALGGSAIVLSATLSARQRGRLARAFARGLGAETPKLTATAYPLVTVTAALGAREEAVATRADRERKLPVRFVETADAGLAYVNAMAARGAAVAWIRNSVDDAIEAVEQLRAQGPVPVLLHARFAMGDRLKIEDEVRRVLGRNGDPERRRGFVLVGTQILEQSLDYDVDAMVTDLAPVDLVIQRAGRLWRHTERMGRPLDAPELVVVAPDWGGEVDADWYRQVSPRAAAVYKHHGLVWRSVKALSDVGAILTPGGIRDLIARVYDFDEDDLEDVPQALQRASKEAIGAGFAERSVANANLLKVENGYGGDGVIWTSDTITPTRLGEPVTVFRLGRIEGSRIVPWCDDGDAARSWALSEVSLARRKAIGVPPPDAAMAKLIDAAKASWPEWEREQPLLVLHEEGAGSVLGRDKAIQSVLYNCELGMRIVS